MKQPKKLQSIAILVSDLKLMEDFYVNKLGLRLVKKDVSQGFVQIQLGNQFLELYDKKFVIQIIGEENVSQESGKSNVIFSFSKSDEMDEECAQFKSAGVEFIRESEDQPWGERTAYFKDPEGNIWEMQAWTNKNAILKI